MVVVKEVRAVKLPKSLLEVAVVTSSVLLVSGFISYRAGAFNGLMATSPKPDTMMSTSKSLGGAPVIDQPTTDSPGAQPAPTTPPARTFLPSSKSGLITGGP